MKRLMLIVILGSLCVFGFAQAMGNYTFTYGSATYTEITEGTILGNESTDAQRFVDPASPLGGTTDLGVGFPLGFNFYFGGQEFDRVGICAEGWLSLGQSWETTPVRMNSSSYYSPLGSTYGTNPPWLVDRIAGMALNMSAQTGAALQIKTIGSAPYRIFVAQWTNYKKAGSGGTGDSYNFQIRLEETTNKVVIAYGTVTNNATDTSAQVGLRGAPANPATNYANRSTSDDWSSTSAGTAATDNCTLSSTVYPSSGTTFSWTPPATLNSSYTIGSTGDFTTFAAAFNFLNANYPLYGIPENGTTFNIAAGETFNQAELLPSLTATGTVNHPIVFQKSGTGSNPLLKVMGTTATTDSAIKLDGCDYITFDGLDIQNQTGTALEYGFHLAAQAYDPCNSNTLTNCVITLDNTNSNTKGVYSQGASYAGNTNNSYTGLDVDNCNTGIHLLGSGAAAYYNNQELVSYCDLSEISEYGIYFDYSTNLRITQNTIAMRTDNTTAFYGVYVYHGTAEVDNNTIIGNTTSTTAYGLYARAGTLVSWHHNTIRDFTGTGSAYRYGIYIYNGNHDIFSNEIHAISATGHVWGIYTYTYADVLNIYNNEIHNLQYTGPSGSAYTASGITLRGADITVANNQIYDLGSSGDGAPMIRGIVTETGTSFKIYYNTIYLKGGNTNTNFGSAGLYITSTGPTLDIRNNIVVDLSTPGTATTGRATAIWKTYTGFANFASSCDRNIYYAGTPGPKNLICYDNGAAYETLADYKNAVINCELGSLTESVPFVSTIEPYDIHIPTGASTLAESNALPIAGWDFDFDGDDRDDEFPDIGADEGAFTVPAIPPDPPVLINPADGAIVVQPGTTLDWAAASSGGAPTGYRLHFGTDLNSLAVTDLGNVTSYDPDPDLDFLTTYYWKIVPYNATGPADSTSYSHWSFETHAAPLTGNYIIGSSGYYPDFTLAITHLNAAGVGSGGVTFQAIAGEVFAENPPPITATGTADDPILFTSTNTSGTNPLLTPTGGTGSFGIKIESGDYITFDHIDIANVPGSTDLIYGFWLYSVSADAASYITIQNCSVTLDESVSGTTAVYMDGSGSSYGNHFLSNTIDSSRQGFHLYPSSEAYNMVISGNVLTNVTNYAIYNYNSTDSQITGNNISFPTGSTQSLVGLYARNLTNGEVSNNVISGGSTTSTCYGFSQRGGNVTWHDNLLYNIHSDNDFEGFKGISGTVTFYGNTLYGLSSNSTIYGLELSFEYGGSATVYNNLIHDLSSAATGADYVQGILSNGTDNTIYNNMIYDLRNPGASTAPQVCGIHVNGRTANLYYNTVYLNETGTSDSYSSTALYVSGGTSTLANNNIFMNLSTPGTSGYTSALRKDDDGFANINAATDHNIYYAGTPGTQNVICWTPSVNYQSLDDYKASAASFDQESFTEAVPFVNASSPYDLHLTPGAATLAESNAIAIAGITDDFDQDPRWGETGYAGTGSAPDIGADEGDFTIPLQIPAPAIVVSPTIGEYAVDIVPTLTWYASASGGAPTGYRIYLYAEDPLTVIENGTDLGNVLSYTSAQTLDFYRTYYWRIVPYNENGAPEPEDCPLWNFSTHQAPLTGNWVIGSTGFYPDFTHAIRYLNASGVGSGGVTFTAIAGEVFVENPPAITATGTEADPVVFISTDTLATNPKITPTGGTGTFGIKLEGGDFFTFDHIDIANASGSTDLMYGFWLEAPTGNGCTDNSIQNCAITLDKSAECYAIRGDSASGRVNHRNKYLRNIITNVRNGIYLYNTTASEAPVIQSNVITDFNAIAIHSRTSTGIDISYNQIDMAANNTLASSGVNCRSDNGIGNIHHNTITGANTTQSFTGIYHTSSNFDIHHNSISGVTSANDVYGIRNLDYYSANYRLVYSNSISNLSSTGNYNVWGIWMNRGTIYQNTVTDLVSTGHVKGISAAYGSVYQNTIHNLQTNASANSVVGVYTQGTVTVHNNMICDLRAPVSTTLPQVRGIHVQSGTANLYYNSVLITGSGAETFSPTALYDYSGSAVTLQNNIFSNLASPGAAGKSVAFWKNGENFDDISTASNNNIWYAGTPGAQNLICQYGAISCETLEDYKAANLGKDQNSLTEDAPYQSKVYPFDLHLDPLVQTYAEGGALVVSGITVDYDGDERDAESPDIGADEGDFTEIQLPPAIPVYQSPANGAIDLALNIFISWAAGSGGGTPDYYKVYFGETNPPPLVDDHVLNTYYYPFLLPDHTYYWKIDAVNTLGTAAGVEVWSFDTRADDTIMEFPFAESFEEGNNHGSTSINRWTQALGSGSYYWTANTSTNYNRAPKTGSFNVTLRDGGDAWLFRPIYLESGQMYELEFYARQYTSSGSQAILEAKFGNAATTAAMTENIISYLEVVNGDYQRGAGTFTAPGTGIYYLGIHGVCTHNVNYISLDDIGIRHYSPYPVFSVDPTTWNFGMVNVGEATAAKTFVITNLGDADLVILQNDVYLDGPDAGDFDLTELQNDLTITPGNTANLYVFFAPESLGAKSASLVVTDNTNGRSVNVIPLSGRGIGPLEPPCVEDFEDGWIDWITVNGTETNKWELGTVAPYRNSHSAYISANSGATHSYNPGDGSYVHFYHDVAFPSNMDNMVLKFQWKGMGEALYDYLTVHITDTSFIPVAGSSFSDGQIGTAYHSSADWQLVTLPLSAAYAGQTMRLIFSWRNDGGGGEQPPAVIDNIRIFSSWPYLDENAYPLDVQISADGNNVVLTWDKIDGANDYIIEDADMFDGIFSPIGRGYNSFTTPGTYSRRFFRVRGTD
ncbi:MAG: right-handed parallel beta-helix repeat-containing protein [Candidatus Syntrophosphaera sp.]